MPLRPDSILVCECQPSVGGSPRSRRKRAAFIAANVFKDRKGVNLCDNEPALSHTRLRRIDQITTSVRWLKAEGKTMMRRPSSQAIVIEAYRKSRDNGADECSACEIALEQFRRRHPEASAEYANVFLAQTLANVRSPGSD